MPRKKRQQPSPLEEFFLPDGTVVEVRGPGSYLIYRGSHEVDQHTDLCDRITEYLIDKYKYVTPEGFGDINTGPVTSWQALDHEIQICGEFPQITDSGSVRKRIYPRVYMQILALWRAKKRSLSD